MTPELPMPNSRFATKVAYALTGAALVGVGTLHLATPFLTALFCYLALSRLQGKQKGRKLMTVSVFLLLLLTLAYGLGHVVNRAVETLPAVAEKAIPALIQTAQTFGIELPFSDFDSLKELAFEAVRGQVSYLRSLVSVARGTAMQFLFLVVGGAVAIGLFLNPTLDLDRDRHAVRPNLYSECCAALAERFRLLYASFAMVMGAQIVISAINTVLTGIFVFAVGLPHALVVVGLTFLCGLFPVVGNLISNTIIVGIGITVSLKTALFSLAFLMLIHKLEYFLNSKIIGDRIRNPLWLTLLGLVLGERLMGIPGMILAPVVLHYLKAEGVSIRVRADGIEPTPGQP